MAATTLHQLYRPNLGLLTDLYQLTMAQASWKIGCADDIAVFQLSFRRAPFGGGYAVAAGLANAVDYLRHLRFDREDMAYLATLTGNDGEPIFEPEFLAHLGRLEFECDVDAVPEGTPVFGHEPLLRVRGPMLQAQLVETTLLNIVNFQTLIATKAARICSAAGDDDVIEFGLRRAQGVDGALAASRAAYLGGCAATSNVLAGRLYGIPVRGTHAHSWVMAFDSEPEAFDAYARAMPNNCVFLVDTYDTLTGVRHAIDTGRKLRERGHEMVGVRLDSGDLAYLSVEARRLLDEAGFSDAAIVASNDLDEHLIQDLKRQGAAIAVWGVGTRLITAYDQPALGGVYKLGAIQRPGGVWSHRVKLSEQPAKITIPGVLQVRRFETQHGYVADMIYDELTGIDDTERTIVDPKDPIRHKRLAADAHWHDLLVPVARGGVIDYPDEPLENIRQRVGDRLGRLHSATRRFLNPHEYPVGLEPGLHRLRAEMVEAARQRVTGSTVI